MFNRHSAALSELHRSARRFSTSARVLEKLNIPSESLRNFLHLVHPDKFQGFDEEIVSTNQRSLSRLNEITATARKVYKKVEKDREIDKFNDFTLNFDAPRPGILEFWCHQDQGQPLKHVKATFDVPARPKVSLLLQRTNHLINRLLHGAGFDVEAPKVTQIEEITAAKDIPENELFELEMNEYFAERSKDGGTRGVQILLDKEKIGRIHFHPELTPAERAIAWKRMVDCVAMHYVAMCMHEWVDVPIVFVCTEKHLEELPDHVIGALWDFDFDRLVANVQRTCYISAEKFRTRRAEKLECVRHELRQKVRAAVT